MRQWSRVVGIGILVLMVGGGLRASYGCDGTEEITTGTSGEEDQTMEALWQEVAAKRACAKPAARASGYGALIAAGSDPLGLVSAFSGLGKKIYNKCVGQAGYTVD